MAATIVFESAPVSLSGSLPAEWSTGNFTSIAAPREGVLLPAGPSYVAHARRILTKRTLAEDITLQEKAEAERALRAKVNGNGDGSMGLDMDLGDEEEDPELLARDPKEWKSQDHYAILGLQKYRYKATDEQIKIAHRRKVLRHHPDKKAGQAGDSNDDAFFKCIQKAMEVLTNSEKRRQYDSVDEYYVQIEDSLPSAATLSKQIENDPNEFFETFRSVFELEARFSNKPMVPMIGNMNDSKAIVEGFYDSWYNFDSWRSFEYLDKEVNEGSDSRDDKRYTEKKNKAERARRKREDNARLRGLVDLALSLDPRIKRIKQEEKEARAAKKNQRVNGGGISAKQRQEEEKKRQEAEAKRLEDEKEKKLEAKKAKAAAANAAKKARRAARAEAEVSGSANGSAA